MLLSSWLLLLPLREQGGEEAGGCKGDAACAADAVDGRSCGNGDVAAGVVAAVAVVAVVAARAKSDSAPEPTPRRSVGLGGDAAEGRGDI